MVYRERPSGPVQDIYHTVGWYADQMTIDTVDWYADHAHTVQKAHCGLTVSRQADHNG